MKNEDFLDELFEKARNEKDFIPPGDILDKGMQPVKTSGIDFLKRNISIIVIAAVAVIALLGVGIQALLNNKAGIEQLELSSGNNDNTGNSDNTVNNNANDTSLYTNGNSDLNRSVNNSGDSILRNTGNTSGRPGEFSYAGSNPVKTPGNNGKTTDNPDLNKNNAMSGDIDKLLEMQQMPMQEYEINCSRDTVIIAKQGSQFHIESFCFRNSHNEVINGKATVQIKECYSPNSFIRENLSTCSDSNELLETGGMYYLNVMQGIDTLSIRTGFEIGITPNYNVPDRMNLYYGQRDNSKTMKWEPDTLGRIETPLFVAISGENTNIMNIYCNKNYKLEKAKMLGLVDSAWQGRFYSDLQKGRTSFSNAGLVNEATNEFSNISYPMVKSRFFNNASFAEGFGFMCLTRNKYAYYRSGGQLNDTFSTYVPSEDYRKIRIPLFFSINTGWLNLDCPPSINFKVKKSKIIPKNDVVINVPPYMRVNASLYLPQQNSMARPSSTVNGRIVFSAIPKDLNGTLIITSMINDSFYVFRKEIDTDDFSGIKVKFEHIPDFDDYMAWLERAVSTKPVEPAIIEEDPGK